MRDAASRPLDHLVVADLSNSVAGQFAGRLFADNGASVTLYEAVTGSLIRHEPPFTTSSTHGEPCQSSLLFWHLNTGKASRRSVGDPLSRLAADAVDRRPHIVICTDRDTAERTVAALPDAIVGLVTDFADEGPYRDWAGCELVHQALSGSMHYNGRADREPLYGAGHRASIAAGLHLYIRLLSEVLAGCLESAGTRVDVFIHEVAAAMEQNFSTQWSYSRTIPARGEWNRPKGRLRCQDGWVFFFGMGNRRREFFAAFGAEKHADEARFNDWPAFVRNIATVCEVLAPHAAMMTQAELLAAALDYRLVLSPVRTLQDLRDDEQLVARDFWREARIPGVAGDATRSTLGPMWRSAAYEQLRDVGAPALAPCEPTERSAGRPVAAARSTRTRGTSERGRLTRDYSPLDGLRIVDLTSAWAGPMATRVLTALGADVIKVEGPERPDGWRGPRTDPTHLESYPDTDPGERPYNRNAWFNTQNHDKRSIAVDLRTDEGVKLVRSLAAASDVVIANFSPGVLEKLGLGYEELRKVNDQIVVVEMPGFGNTGPLREHRGLGQTMEALSGIASLIGYRDEDEPLGSGSAYLDPMGGLSGAAATLTALIMRQSAGDPQHVEVPQREAAIHWIGELVLDAVENGVEHTQNGNLALNASPHGAYPAAGTDAWIAIAIFDENQWQNLCEFCGWEEWRTDPHLASIEGRRARAECIDAALAGITRGVPKLTLARQLQARGIPAAPVQDGRGLFEDQQLRSRGWFTTLDHPDAGCHDYPGLPIAFGGELFRPRAAAPTLGQHTREVLVELLGCTSDQVDDLAARGIVLCDDRPAVVTAGDPPQIRVAGRQPGTTHP